MLAWSGSEVLWWGGIPEGKRKPTDDGFAFDPVEGSWRELPPAPIPGAYGHALAAGEQVLLLHVSDEAEGLLFDPARDSWQVVPRSPHRPAWGGVSVWTGSELVVWGGGDPGDPENTAGAAYDPATRTWRGIASSPVGLNLASAAWTGREMIVLGSRIDRRNHADSDTAIGAAYDPLADRWREIARSPLSPQSSAIAWLGERLLTYDYGMETATYDPTGDRWTQVPPVSLGAGECYVQAAALATLGFAWACGEVATFDPAEEFWRVVHGGATEPGPRDYTYASGTAIPADGAMLVEEVEITLSGGTPTIGAAGSPLHLWVWKPPPRPDTPSLDEAYTIATAFFQARALGDRAGIDLLLSPEAMSQYEDPDSGLSPLVDDRIRGYDIVNVHRSQGSQGSFEAEVVILLEGHERIRETIFLGQAETLAGGSFYLAITGARPGHNGA